jgi:hypothetical protein
MSADHVAGEERGAGLLDDRGEGRLLVPGRDR